MAIPVGGGDNTQGVLFNTNAASAPNAVTHGSRYTTTSQGLATLSENGLINEDVMQQIWDISKIPLPFTDMIGTTTCKNAYKEWTRDKLQDPVIDQAVADGADLDQNDAVAGDRVGNHCQINRKGVIVSTRAREADTIGRSDELAYQVMRRQQELRRDVEATMLSNQGSNADLGDIVNAGHSAGLGAWLTTNMVAAGGATVTGGGFGTTNATEVAALVTSAAVPAPLAEDVVRNVAQMVYEEGGDPSIFMSTPAVCRKFSEYLFTSSARVATLMADQGRSTEKANALGSVKVFVHDFGILKIVDNRLQQTYTGAASAVAATAFILDPKYLSIGYLHGYRTEPLAKTGLSDRRQMAVDWTLVVNTELAHGQIVAVDPSADAIAVEP